MAEKGQVTKLERDITAGAAIGLLTSLAAMMAAAWWNGYIWTI